MNDADTAAVREKLQHDVTEVRFTQRGLQAQLEDAVTVEFRSLAAVDSSRALQVRCRLQIEECAQMMSGIQDELAALDLPEQRQGA